jgi:hypothetical protein
VSEISEDLGEPHAALALRLHTSDLEVLSTLGVERIRLTGSGKLDSSFSFLQGSRVTLDHCDLDIESLDVMADLILAKDEDSAHGKPIGSLSFFVGADKTSGDLILEARLTKSQMKEICEHDTRTEMRFQFGGLHRQSSVSELLWKNAKTTPLPIHACVTVRSLNPSDSQRPDDPRLQPIEAHLSKIGTQITSIGSSVATLVGVAISGVVVLVAQMLSR